MLHRKKLPRQETKKCGDEEFGRKAKHPKAEFTKREKKTLTEKAQRERKICELPLFLFGNV